MRNQHWTFGSSWPWPGFGYFGRGRFFEAGEVRLAILSLLSEGPKHGYQLMKEMRERSGGAYSASAGSVYPTLQQLEDEGLIAAEQQDGRRVYRLTPAGRQELEKDPEAVRRIWERAEQCEDWGQFMGPEAFSLYGPLAALAKASLRAAGCGHADRARTILERARRDVEGL
jgi:DNA-binding PadR family transcriptional regulator